MSIAKPEQSALGLSNFDPMVQAPLTIVPKYGYRRVVTKILVIAAIAFNCFVGGAAPASADPDAFGADPNPFSGFGCSCRETAPAHSPAVNEEINRGIR